MNIRWKWDVDGSHTAYDVVSQADRGCNSHVWEGRYSVFKPMVFFVAIYHYLSMEHVGTFSLTRNEKLNVGSTRTFE